MSYCYISEMALTMIILCGGGYFRNFVKFEGYLRNFPFKFFAYRRCHWPRSEESSSSADARHLIHEVRTLRYHWSEQTASDLRIVGRENESTPPNANAY